MLDRLSHTYVARPMPGHRGYIVPLLLNRRASLSPDSRVNANRTEAASGEGETR